MRNQGRRPHGQLGKWDEIQALGEEKVPTEDQAREGPLIVSMPRSSVAL